MITDTGFIRARMFSFEFSCEVELCSCPARSLVTAVNQYSIIIIVIIIIIISFYSYSKYNQTLHINFPREEKKQRCLERSEIVNRYKES